MEKKGIGVRALRDGLTRHLARVRRGTRILITDRGTPIAVLAPYKKGERGEGSARLAAVLSSGHVHPAARPFRPDPPLVRGHGKPASQILSEDRR
jgi:prevent-host-death family protein